MNALQIGRFTVFTKLNIYRFGVAYLRDDFTDQTIEKWLQFAQNYSLIQQPHRFYYVYLLTWTEIII